MHYAASLLEKKLNLKAMKLLIVDENEFSRSFTRNICQSFRFDKIIASTSASEALGQMRSSEVDMMLVDWLLTPDRGGEFVRAVRTQPGIRTPFVPIIVLSGETDAETVSQARDAGANEVMNRPFELGQLLMRFAQVLLTPRPFIRCSTYVGPERRRQQRPIEGPDRRTAGGARAMRPPSAAAAAAKAAGPGGTTIGAMKEAGEKVIVEEEKRYSEVRSKDLEEMTGFFAELSQATVPDLEIVKKIYLKSQSLKAMGETFGFPLLTQAGESLCHLLWQLPREQTTAPLTIRGVEAHIRTMKLIVAQNIKHDGGAVGAELIATLRALSGRVCPAEAVSPAA